MPEVSAFFDGEKKTLQVPGQTILLHALRDSGIEVFSPCGGKGTCGKCRIHVKSEGAVSSCTYKVSGDIEVSVPDSREARILSEQHRFTLKLPFSPGPAANLSARAHGIAIDLGTTSMVYYLVNLRDGALIRTVSELNPQSMYGADVITRINYTAEDPDGLKTLQSLVISSINEQAGRLAEKSGISREQITRVAIAGNTTMLHLLLGIDPLPMALAPFTPAFTDEQRTTASLLGLDLHPEAEIVILPSVSAYVGADIVAGLASIRPMKNIRNFLFMDIGTNGELALVQPGGILCCSTAAGPAFEGARISCGMGGVAGAISEYHEDGYRVIGDVPAAGICGSGLIDLVARLLDTGLLQRDGTLKEEFRIVPEKDSGAGKNIRLNQQDVREVQLAKSALAAGLRVLISESGFKMQGIDALFLAGGFGTYIRPESAIRIGLIPAELGDRIISLGNTSGTGALLSLRSTMFDDQVSHLLERTRYLELSGHEGFTTEFAMNMDF